MENIYLTKKNKGKEVWLNFKGEKGHTGVICLNNLANKQKEGIIKKAMVEAIAKETTKCTPNIDPSKLRKEGYEAFCYNEDPRVKNPYPEEEFGESNKRGCWFEGWNEARKQYLSSLI